MLRTAWLSLPAVAVSLALFGTGRAAAQTVLVSPWTAYYTPPAVSCYGPPAVSYYAPAVSYYEPAVSYYAPAVSYYAPAVSYYTPAVSYYAPAVSYYPSPVAVTTTRYGLFGRPRATVTRYYP
jgi:hypothetical protein